jgi:hypothetical protein
MINLIIRLLNLKTDRLNTYLNLLCKIEETIQNKEYEKLIFQRQAEEDLIRFLSSLQKTESNFELLVSQEFLYSNKEIILLKDKIKSQYEQINKQYKNVQDQIIKVLPLIQSIGIKNRLLPMSIQANLL